MIFDTNFTLTSGEDTFGKLKRARQGSHYIIVYRDLPTLRKIYSQYTKRKMADMGSFFCYNKLNDLIEYEMSLQRTSDIKAKGFCFHKGDDFKWRISRIERKKLLDHHGRELMIAPTPTVK